MSAEGMQSDLRRLSRIYYDQNGSSHEVLQMPPTALEFSRLVHISRPVLVKGVHLPAMDKWTDEYLIRTMGIERISVAVTPDGRADAITAASDGCEYFLEPLSEQMTMEDLLNKLKGADGASWPTREVYYLQSQNGNLYDNEFFINGSSPSQYASLRKDVVSEVAWCSEALGRPPDAVNLWIGNARSVTSIHSDPYQNIYTVVRGSKHFTLLPPTDGWCLREREYPHATYTRSPSGELTVTPSPESTPSVRWSSIAEPHLPGNLAADVHPIHVTVDAGDTLYLPAGWWHHVRQGGGHGGTTIAINWWYDMEMRGMGWVWLSFLRGLSDAVDVDDEVID